MLFALTAPLPYVKYLDFDYKLKRENVNREFFKKQNPPIPHFISTFMSSFLKKIPLETESGNFWKILAYCSIFYFHKINFFHTASQFSPLKIFFHYFLTNIFYLGYNYAIMVELAQVSF